MALTEQEEAKVRSIIVAFDNGKRLNELPRIGSTNPFDLIVEVLDTDGESKQAELAAMLPYIEQQCAYGVQWDVTVSSPDMTRIGNSDLHRSLPIQNRIKGCLLDDNGNVTEYLTPNNWLAHDLTGARGQVMVEIPQHYRKFDTLGNIRQCLISEYPLPGYHLVRKKYVSANEATLERSTGKLCSVVNFASDYRGGGNQSSYDGTYRSMLGIPATGISRTAFRAAARKRNNSATAEWNCMDYNAYKDVAWLFYVEYATRNSQKEFNAEKDINGFAQGGLGAGVTNIDGTKWSNLNGYYPFIPCGYTASLGNNTGMISFTMPFEYDANGEANYKGVFDSLTQYYTNNYVSSGNDLYKCILDSVGNDVTNTTYFQKVTRTVTNVPSYRGIQNPFGHIWKWSDGINIEIKTDADGGTSKVYVADDPSVYNDSNYNGYTLRGLEARAEGYIKEMIIGEFGDIMPVSVGAGSTTYWCDYHSTSITASSLRGVLFGGSAYNGAYAGFGYSSSYNAPSNTSAGLGSRLCFIPNVN
jgi:hypothetical protein